MAALLPFILAAALLAPSPGEGEGRLFEVGVDTPEVAVLQPRPLELAIGAEGRWVKRLNDELAAAGFHPDSGVEFGARTRHAVFAFQKHYELETTGVFTTEMWALLDDSPQLPLRSEADRVEVDLAKQVLYLVEDQQVRLVLPVSSGNGQTFINYSGRAVPARTPEGKFTFQRVINGLRVSYLGALYNPFYFYGGYAIHGSPSVPNYPASHGCIRVTNWDMDLLKQHLQVGEVLYVYGMRTDPPEAYSIPNPPPELR